MRWQILNKIISENVEDLQKILLSNRGLKNRKKVNDFLNPKNPCDLSPKDVNISPVKLNKAIKIIQNSIDCKEQIIVYGDYDCDGISATAILWETLHKMGADVMPYIPDRVEDGYGLSVSGLNKLKEKLPAAKLIITVDHGIVAVEQTRYAKKLGLKVIITDHHTLGKKLPKADAIVHTTSLSGSGISWFLASQLLNNFKITQNLAPGTKSQVPSTKYSDELDLAALGTIADMVPLVGANRSIAKYGLDVINSTKRTGLLALFNESGMVKGAIGTYEIGYILAPRINALGRIDNALDSLRLLCTKDTVKAALLASRLNAVNIERQKLTESTTLHAKQQITISTKQEANLIFISHEMYNQGIIGLVAGKLVEEYYKPAVVVCRGEKISKASARSILGYNIIEAIRSCSDLVIEAGGHPMAAGFTVSTGKLLLLEEKLKHHADKNIKDEDLVKSIKIDCKIPLQNVNWDLYETINSFKPFGMANFEPVFCSEAEVVETRLVGKEGKHMKISIIPISNPLSRMTNSQYNAIAFNFLKYSKMLHQGDKINIAYTISSNEWNGEKKIQLKIKDIVTTNNK